MWRADSFEKTLMLRKIEGKRRRGWQGDDQGWHGWMPSPTPGVHPNSCPSSRWSIQPSHPRSSPSPPAPNPSQHQGLFQWVGSLHQGPEYWSFSFSISPSNEYSGLISFRIDWFDLLAIQGTLKSLLQHHSSKASMLRRSAFFLVRLSHPCVTTGKTIALTIGTFVGKVMSLLFTWTETICVFRPH